MTEDEFRALLAIEGGILSPAGKCSDGAYMVVIHTHSDTVKDWAYGKTEAEAIQKLIHHRYADN